MPADQNSWQEITSFASLVYFALAGTTEFHPIYLNAEMKVPGDILRFNDIPRDQMEGLYGLHEDMGVSVFL